jgi:hypothetical protein
MRHRCRTSATGEADNGHHHGDSRSVPLDHDLTSDRLSVSCTRLADLQRKPLRCSYDHLAPRA